MSSSQLTSILLPVVQLVVSVAVVPIQLLLHLFSVVERALHPTQLTDHKVVVITGANSGIGEGLALHYAKAGVTLGLIARNKERLDAVAKICRQQKAIVQCGYIDVTDEVNMSKFLSEMDARTPIDLVIANAGVTASTVGHQKDIVKATKALFQINIDGLFNTILPLVEPMKSRRKGQIVVMSSLASYTPTPKTTPYNATKAAVRLYARSLRGMLLRDNVHVNVICPGYVQTPLTSAVNLNFKKYFILTMPECVKAIVYGLENDIPEIAFPSILYMMSWITGNFVWTAWEFAAKYGLLGPAKYFSKRENKKSN